MSFVIDNVVEINASAEDVWRILTDFDSYGTWNPLAVECASSLVPGEPIEMSVILLPGGRPLRQREWIRSYTPGYEFSYTMKPLRFGALRSLRSQTVTPLGDGRTRYSSHFELGGWLSPLVRLLLGARLRRGFDGMTSGIVTRAAQLGSGATGA